MIIYTIFYHFKHYKPYYVYSIDINKENLNAFILILEKNNNIIIDHIVKNID